MKKNIDRNLLLRSLFFVPAHVDKFFDGAMKSDADALAFDLEDGVPAEEKEKARESLKTKLTSIESDYPVFIRVNSRETGLFEKDVEAMCLPEVNGFIFPKVKNAQDIIYLESLLLQAEKRQGLSEGKFFILPLIETAEAVLNVFKIAKASTRVLGVIFGHEDFLLDLCANHAASPYNLIVPRTMISMAARAAGILPIDTPYLQLKDPGGCARYIQESRELGFSGMLVLHPSQIKVANEGYAPSQEEIIRAEKIVTLSEEAKKNNRSIAFVDGKFIAPPILKQAKLVLEFSKRLQKRQEK